MTMGTSADPGARTDEGAGTNTNTNATRGTVADSDDAAAKGTVADSDDDAAASHRPVRRWAVVVTIVVGYLVHLAWRVWLTRRSVAPLAHPDEDGYLVAARAIAGGPGGYSTENGPFRRVGYPLLISPSYLVGSDDAFDVYRRVQFLNAIIGAALVPLAAVFARRVLALPARWAVGAALAAATLPAVVYYTGMAMTDAVLPTFVVAWLVLLHGWLASAPGRGRWVYAVGSGAAAGLMNTLHVRGMMVVIVHGLVAVAVLASRRVEAGDPQRRWSRARWLPVVASVGAVGAVACVDPLCKAALGDSIQLLGDSPGSQVTAAVTVNWGIALILLRVVGQLWYLSLATAGVGTLGLVAAAYPLCHGARRRRLLADPAQAARLLTLGAALLLTMLVAFGSASSLPFGEHRITYFAYARYLHFLMPVWLLVGLATLRTARARRPAVLALAASAVVVFLLAAAVVGWRTGQAVGYAFVAFDAPELLALSNQWTRFEVLRPTLVALGCFLTIVAVSTVPVRLGRRTRPDAANAGLPRSVAVLVLPLVALLGVVAVQQTQRNFVRPVVDVQYPAVTPQLVRDLHLGPGDVVAEAWQVEYPFPLNHDRELYWQRPLRFDAAQPPPAQATVVIAPWYPGGQRPSWDGAALGMRPIGADPFHGWAVWRRGG